jgi:energy-coupling factor transport system ATP-binding protein
MNTIAYINVEKMSFSYQKSQFSLNDIDLELYKNDITALVGDNGSGKTTLGKILTGILKPCKGNILINGENISKLDLGEIGKKVGYLFQNPEKQIFATSVYEDVSFPLEINGIEPNEIKDRTDNILAALEIDHLKDKYPFNLSHGEKQRVALAGILIHKAEYLILDEPTTALDSERKELLGSMLKNLNAQGTGVLIISHDEKFISKYCSRVIRMKKEGGIIND